MRENTSRFQLVHSLPLLKILLHQKIGSIGEKLGSKQLLESTDLLLEADIKLSVLLSLFHKSNDINIKLVISVEKWNRHWSKCR